MPARVPAKVVLLICIATTSIVVGDAAGKLLTQSGVSPFFIAWSRFALAAGLLLPLSGMTRAELPQLWNWRVVLRAALIAGGISSILTALRTEPIANVYGAFFIGPVVAYALSVLLLNERVTRARTVLLAIGFLGVLMVVQPSTQMGPGMLFALLAGMCYGSYLTATRWLAGQYRPRFLLTAQLVIGALLLAPLGLTHLPGAGSPAIWGLVLLSALASALGNFLLVLINRTTPATISAPLIYFQLIAAAVLGIVVFADWPDLLSLLGLGVILASGLGGFVLAQRNK
ncbi:DMT family transporter [Thalassovita sp.]|uniref:DMT family transporter n=1 Tax=Thalassovita sp. TaxID=1979401 RepID=UPI002880E5CD|nr:DMT family transporter [Thalassovita sp.]MDF1803697.1 DMT family transporter [Thalassovita sp.]